MSLDAMVGSRLMFGLPGPDVTDDDVRLFRETRAAGIMLYRRNFETPERQMAITRKNNHPRFWTLTDNASAF